jgi:Phage integrase family
MRSQHPGGSNAVQWKTFQSNLKRAKIEQSFGIHSIRHGYGTWLSKFIPHPNGFGLPIHMVSKAMGHANITSTQVYAQVDREVMLHKIQKANALMQQFGFDPEAFKILCSKSKASTSGGSMKFLSLPTQNLESIIGINPGDPSLWHTFCQHYQPLKSQIKCFIFEIVRC